MKTSADSPDIIADAPRTFVDALNELKKSITPEQMARIRAGETIEVQPGWFVSRADVSPGDAAWSINLESRDP
jgi:hypothetical protein